MRKLVLVLALVLVLVLVGLGWLQPRDVRIERTTTIAKPPAAVFGVLVGFDRFNEWSPWAAKDPHAIYTREGPAVGAGATLRFEGDPARVGSGYHRIVLVVPLRRVVIESELGPHRGRSSFALAPAGDGTALVFSFETDLGTNPITRWRGREIEADFARDIETGLRSLKALVERLPPSDGAPVE